MFVSSEWNLDKDKDKLISAKWVLEIHESDSMAGEEFNSLLI